MTIVQLPFTSIRSLVERFRLRNETAIQKVVRRVKRGEYTIILGPRFSEKTFLLEDVASELRELDMAPILVNLEPLEQRTGSEFIAALADAVAGAGGPPGPHPRPPRTERELQEFLKEIPATLEKNVVLLFDHLEVLPVNNMVLLLRVLRAMLTEAHAITPRFSICAVATSTFRVADISLGPVSPFNVTKPVWLSDLRRDETGKLIDQIARELDISLHETFSDGVYSLTNGDRYAVALLCNYCAELAKSNGRDQVTSEDLEAAAMWFLDHANEYPPLQETRRSLEHDPDSLLALAAILDRGAVPERELPISISRPDHLRLTGAVRTEASEDGTVYRPRSNLYARALSQYYHAARVSRVLFVAGCFDEAVEYLRRQPSLRTDRRTRAAFLDSITGSIFAARSVKEAADSLAASICAAFDMTAATVYLVTADRAKLTVISQCGSAENSEISLDSDAMEKHAFFSEHYVMQAQPRRVGIPLRDRDDDASGVIVASDFNRAPRDDDFAELLAFVRRIAKALGRVLDHERRLNQLQRLQTISREVASSVDLDEVLKKTVEEGTKAIPGAQRGALLLYDDDDRMLHVREQRGYRKRFFEEMVVDPKGGSYAATVFQKGEPILIHDASTDQRVTMRGDEDIAKQLSVLCVPLSAWGRSIGLFCVDNITAHGAFRKADEGLLSAFAAPAAIAIQNAMVYQELYELSLAINSGDLHADDIFRRAVRSIVRVTGATASNMLLLRDTNDPTRAVAQPPLLSIAHGMGDDFEHSISLRPNGITFHALSSKEPVIVPSSEYAHLTINPLSQKQGVQMTIALRLSIKAEILGVLFVNFATPHEFSPDEKHILSLYANECAVAIERVRHEEQLVHASVAWMGLDLSEMGHDITQGVTRLQSNLYMLSRRLGPDSELAALVDAARHDAETIASVPRRALVPASDRMEEFDLLELIRREAQRWCKAHPDVDLDLRGVNNESSFVAAHPRRIAKVVKTLMQNAVRAAKTSTRPAIRVASHARGRTINITFSNTGTAISPDVAARLFREPVRSSGGGQGVGLLIARSIVFGYAGDLQLTSSDDNQTVLTLSLPLAWKTHEGATDS
ncbi:MAG TPA: GAF domain-containing protein [Thermoanaerobaculia bacterium]|nr:GAF domain-containing protein [Thermoanaerobaculia bacterium]